MDNVRQLENDQLACYKSGLDKPSAVIFGRLEAASYRRVRPRYRWRFRSWSIGRSSLPSWCMDLLSNTQFIFSRYYRNNFIGGMINSWKWRVDRRIRRVRETRRKAGKERFHWLPVHFLKTPRCYFETAMARAGALLCDLRSSNWPAVTFQR